MPAGGPFPFPVYPRAVRRLLGSIDPLRIALGLLAVGAASSCSGAIGTAGPYDVVLVTIDTTRADHLSLYGYHRPTSPAIDALAAQGAVCLDAWSQAPNTCPSITSALTSRRAPITLVRGNPEHLDAGVPTIGRVAGEAGWRTGAFVSSALLWKKETSLHPGFDVYDDTMTDPCWGHENAQRVARKTIDAALAWRAQDDGRPSFTWIHLYDPHGPYSAPEPTPDLDASEPLLPPSVDLATWRGAKRIPKYLRVPGLVTPADFADAYDREIRYADDQLGRLFDTLDLSRTVVAIHADHGEALGEDAYWFRHGNLLHDPALRIPMVIVGPGVPAGRRVASRVRNLDLAPTVAALAGLPPIPDAEGRDLSSLLADPDEEPAPVAFVAEGRRREIVKDDTGIDVRWKLRYVDSAGIDVLWWPAVDERRVAAGTPRDVVTAMDSMWRWLKAPKADDGPDAVDPDTEAALRGLGYTAPSETTTPTPR